MYPHSHTSFTAEPEGPILVSLAPERELAPSLIHALQGIGRLYFWPDLSYFEQERIGQIASIVIGTARSRVGAELLRRLPVCRLIASLGMGYDGYDIESIQQRGIILTHTPENLSDDVADLAISMMITLSRNLKEADLWVREGRWPDGRFPAQYQVTGKRIGILGLGNIGLAIAKRAQAFRMEIGYHDRVPKPTSMVYFPDCMSLAAWADFLVAIVPGTPETYHMIDADVLRALGTKGFLINVARGSVVDTQALITALQNGTIAGAALDVFENEPYVEAQLKTLPNTVLSPHIGIHTHETREALVRQVVENIQVFLRGRQPPGVVPECKRWAPLS